MCITSIFIRIYFLSIDGPRYAGDSDEYLEVMNNISNGLGFSRIDPGANKLMPYADKPPVFYYAGALTKKVLGNNLELNIIILNLFCSICVILLSIYFSNLMTGNHTISLITGWLMSLNINLIFNSLLIMSDTFYLFIILFFMIFTFKALKRKKIYMFFIIAVILGISILTRTLLKFYWIFFIIFIAFIIKENKLNKKRFITAFLLGYVLTVVPYHIRNYVKLRVISPIEMYQSVASLYAVMPLIEGTDYSGLTSKYSHIKEISKMCAGHDMPPCPEISQRFKLTMVDLNKYFTAMTFYTIIKNPLGYIKIYIKSLISCITSAGSPIFTIEILRPGYFRWQHF
jgi:hypothetical protein